MKTRKSVIAALNKIEEITIITMFSIMVIVIFAQVIMRYVFNNSLYWSEELGKFLFVWISWLGISLGEREGEHIKITMLTDRLSFKKAHVFNIISSLTVLVICLITFYFSSSLVMSQWTTKYAGIHISISWGYLAVAVGTGLMSIRSVAAIMKSFKTIKEGPSETEGEVALQEEMNIEKGGEA
ncbi:MAG TPA: TRAP transporter small permease [Clostridiales bacterium]|nr:TRAP transporter small permease [Clostridiales bacterium]